MATFWSAFSARASSLARDERAASASSEPNTYKSRKRRTILSGPVISMLASAPLKVGRLGGASRRERAEVGDVSIDSKVSLITTEDRGFNIAVELDVTLPQVQDAEEAKKIVAAAHEICPYSNATRGNVEVTLTANGQPVG